MKDRATIIPFGLLFEELAPQARDRVVPVYNEETNLSYIMDSYGHWVPYVEIMGAIGTDTFTLVRAEPTDTDPGDDQPPLPPRRVLTSTDTFTKEREEQTDRD